MRPQYYQSQAICYRLSFKLEIRDQQSFRYLRDCFEDYALKICQDVPQMPCH